MPDAIDRVGIGVDLYGGQIVLQELRAIREEMKLIAGMGSGRPPGGGAGSSGARDIDVVETRIKTKEKAEIDSIKRITKAETDANRAISKDEDRIYADTQQRRAEAKRRGDAELLRREKATQQEMTRIAEQAEIERQQMITRQRNQFANTRSPTLAKQANQLFEQTPIRTRSGVTVIPGPNRVGYTASQQINQLAQNIPIIPRSSVGIIPGLNREQIISERQQAAKAAALARQAEIERRAADSRILSRTFTPSILSSVPASLRKDIELDIEAQNFAKKRKMEADDLAATKAYNAEKKIQQALRRTDQRINEDIRTREILTEEAGIKIQEKALATATKVTAQNTLNKQRQENQVEYYQRREAEMARREANRAQLIANAPIEQVRDFRQIEARREQAIQRRNEKLSFFPSQSTAAGSSSPTPPPTPPTPPIGPIGPKAGLFNDKGFFTTGDAIGRITRNILLYEVVSRASYGLVTYIQNAITAAKVTVEFGNALRFATQQAGGNVGENERLADSLGAIGLSRQQGRAAVTEAARFAINRPEDTAALTTTVSNIAAARGLGVDKTDELIEQLRRRESKFYKRVFGTTVESIYEAEAAKRLDSQAVTQDKTPGLYIGLSKSEIKSRTESINDFVGAMDDAAKETAIFNYILSQSGRFAGEAAERADTLAGRIDKIAASFLNAQENVGLFITELKPVNALVDKLLGGAGFLEKLRPAMLQRTGSGGSISQADIQQYAADKTTGFRARALEEANTLGGPLVLGGLAAAGLGVLGRGQAQSQARTQAYEQAYTKYLAQFDGNVIAAQTAAYEQAKNLKPGMVNSVKAGVSKLTLGMTDAILTNVNNITGSNLQTSTGYQRTRFVPNLIGQDLVGQRSDRGRRLPAWDSIDAVDQWGRSRPWQGPNPIFGDYGRLTTPSLAATGGRETGPQRYMPYITGSPYKPTTVSESDIKDLNRLTAGAGMVGGITGGIIGANLGALAAESLKVGPITATGLTIAGGVVGTAVGTSIGQTISSLFSDYVIKSGGLKALITGGAAGGVGAIAASEAGVAGVATTVGAGATSLAGGFSALMTSTVALGTVFGALATAGTAIVGLLAGGGIGALINYLNPDDYMSQEQKTLDRQAAAEEANKIRLKELMQSSKEGLIRYTDLRPSPLSQKQIDATRGMGFFQLGSTFNQSLSERQARQMSGFQYGFEGPNRRFSQQILQGNEPILRSDTLEKVQQQRLDVESRINKGYGDRLDIENKLSILRRKDLHAPENKYLQQDVIAPLEEQLVLYEKLGKIKTAEENFKLYGTNDPAQIANISDYRARQTESINKRLQQDREEAAREQAKADEMVTRQRYAVQRVRDAQDGSLRLVESRAANQVGKQNPFVGLLSAQATIGQRVELEKGWMGPERVAEQIENELKQINRALNEAEFDAQKRIGDISLMIGREKDIREGPGLGRKDQDYLAIQSAIVDKAKEIPQLWIEASKIVNMQRLTVQEELTGRVNLITKAFGVQGVTLRNRLDQDITNRDNSRQNALGQSMPGFFDLIKPRLNALGQSMENPEIAGIFQSVGRGESPELQRELQKAFADTIIETFRDYSPQQIIASGQGELYYNALRYKTQDTSAISDLTRKRDMGIREDYRLKQVMSEDEEFRRSQLLAGYDVKDVGRESDKLLLARTEGISPKDLSYDQFAARQEALKRTAEREVSDQADAKAAVQLGLDYQEAMITELEVISQAILGGDINALIRIENNARAEVDQKALQRNQGPGGYKVPLDRRRAKSSPYADLNNTYGRHGER